VNNNNSKTKQTTKKKGVKGKRFQYGKKIEKTKQKTKQTNEFRRLTRSLE